jgi:hypothetical protein
VTQQTHGPALTAIALSLTLFLGAALAVQHGTGSADATKAAPQGPASNCTALCPPRPLYDSERHLPKDMVMAEPIATF